MHTQITDPTSQVDHHYADNNGVQIHYVTSAKGPLVLAVYSLLIFGALDVIR